MGNQKKFIVLLFGILSIFLATACSQETSQASGNSTHTLNFGAISSVDVIPIIIASEEGFFEDQGLEVNFEPFNGVAERDAALNSGNLDGIISDIVAITLFQNGGFDIKITGITDGDFILVANQHDEITSMNDLVGKQVAISEKSLIEYTLDKILAKNNIAKADIEKIVIPAVPARLEMLRQNGLDAALLPEPFSTLALNEGAVHLGSANQEGLYPSVSAFTQEAIETKEDEIKAFYLAYNQAVDYINQNDIAEYEDLIIETVGYPENMKGDIDLPTFRKNTLPSTEEIQAVIDWVSEYGLLEKDLSPADLLSDIGI